MLATLIATLIAAHPLAQPEVTIRRAGAAWRVTYELPSDEPAWAFNRSATARADNRSWRVGHWRVLTDGVQLTRRDGHDVLVAEAGTVPRRLELGFVPRAGELNADYEPALLFSDGTLALFTGHFDVSPEGARERWSASVRIEAPGETILANGAFHEGAVALESEPTYALLGETQPLVTPDFTAFIDPGLPDWAHEEMIDFVPSAMRFYSEQMGSHGGTTRPLIMISWKGPTPQMAGLSGSVLEGLIAASIEGEGVVTRDVMMEHRMRWFIAHEAAHFWLGQQIQYEKEGDAWIIEGGADVAALRAVDRLRPGLALDEETQGEWRDCESALESGPLYEARERGDFRMPYACGAVLMFGAEAVSGDFFGFVRTLIARHGEEKFVDSEEWLAAFADAGASREAVSLARAIIADELDDPVATLRRFARATGATYPQGGAAS